MTAVFVPLPTAAGWCTTCRRNVAINAQGRCPADGILAIWPEGKRRPELVTEIAVKLMEAARIDRTPAPLPRTYGPKVGPMQPARRGLRAIR